MGWRDDEGFGQGDMKISDSSITFNRIILLFSSNSDPYYFNHLLITKCIDKRGRIDMLFLLHLLWHQEEGGTR